MFRRKPSLLQKDRAQSRRLASLRRSLPAIEALEGRTLLSVSFGSPVEQGGAPAATGITQSDFNNDGKTDLAIAATDAGAGQVAVYLGNGNGTFNAPTVLADPGSHEAYGIASFDFNGDNRNDLAVTNPLQGTVSIYLSNGDGTFQAARSFAYGTPQAGTSAIANIAAGIFGGKVGLAITNPGDHEIDLLTTSGDGNFTVAQRFTNNNEAGFSPNAIIAAGFTNVGSFSIAYSEGNSPYVGFANWGGTGFSNATQNAVAGTVQSLAIGDFNNDGSPDIAATTANGYVGVLINQGGGIFVENNFQSFLRNPNAIATGFFDNANSQQDIAVMDTFGDLAVLAGQGNGSFSHTPAFTNQMSNTATPQRLIAGRFYGGTMQDLAYSELNSSLTGGGGVASMHAGATPTPLPNPNPNPNPGPQFTSPLIGTFTGKLPATVIAGTRTVIRQTLLVKNTGTTTLKGLVNTTLFLSVGPSSTSGSLGVGGSHPKRINLRPGKQVRIPIRIGSIPTTITPGNYYLTMELSDPNAHLSIASTTKPIGVASPQIDLSGQFLRVPATVKAGRKTTATLLVTNHGNVPAKGGLPIFIYVSPQPTLGANPTAAASKPLRINIRPGKSARIRIPNLSLPTGSNYLVAVMDPANLFQDVNTANNTFATSAPVSVA